MMGDLDLGRGEWRRGHEPMGCYPRASLLGCARERQARGVQLISVHGQHLPALSRDPRIADR